MNVKIFGKELRPKQSFLGRPIEPLNCGLEAEINAWLALNPKVIVKEVKQSMAGGSWQPAKLIISVWYE